MRAEDGESSARFFPEGSMRHNMFRLVLTAVLLTALTTCTKTGRSTQGDFLARVNNQEIQREAYVLDLHEARTGSTEPLPADPVTWLQVKVAFLDQMVERLLIEQEAARRQIAVVDQDVDSALAAMREDWPDGAFPEALAQRQITLESLRRAIRHDLLTDMVAKKVVLPGIEVPEVEVQSHYRSNATQFTRPEQVRARQILVRTEAEAAELLTRILTGASFIDLARKHSTAPEAAKGGDLGYFGRDQMPSVVENACFALDVHQVSDIIKSQYGYHLFYVEDHRPAAVIPLNAARGQIVRELRDSKFDRAWQDFLARLKSAANIEINEAQLASIGQDEL